MTKHFIFIFISLLFFACSGSDEIKIPINVLSKEKMAEVLVDMHLMEATLNLNAGSTDKNGKEEKLKIDIYKKHNITTEQYRDSYRYYTENPESLTEVYDIVLNELSKLQAAVSNSK